MLGASRTSWAALEESLRAQYDEATSSLGKRIENRIGVGAAADFSTAGSELMSIANLLEAERSLRSTLADPAIEVEAKRRTVTQLFGSQVGELAISVFQQIVESRWSSDSDLLDATEEAGATLILMAAEIDGHIDRVEEELFRFGRAIDANPSLQMALTDPASNSETKSGIVHSLLDGRAAPETVVLVSHVAGSLRGRRIQDAITGLSELAAARRGRVIADVRAASALTDEQSERLAAVLSRIHGRSVELNVEVDPEIIGGIEVRIGDEVIDGTTATKLEQARRRMTG